MIKYLDKFSLSKKTAFVTGGAGLIGAQISSAFASAGAETVIIDIQKKNGIELSTKLNKKLYSIQSSFF